MKKRGYFSLVMLLITTTLFAVTDIGSAKELVITETPLAHAEQNTASTVSVITQEEIKTYNAQSTAELVGKAIGVTYQSYGSLGALQNVIIRGASSSKSLIFLNGVPLGSALDGTVDLSIIPIQSIERIEVIKSGTGNLGRTNAIGGMVNIITKKGTSTPTPFTLTVENGSFLPLAKNWRSLVDSQRVDLSYTKDNLFATVGTTLAQNAYLYDNNTTLRENAHLYEGHGSVSYSHTFSPTLTFSTNNIVTYKNLGTPGSATFPSPTDYMNDLLLTTSNNFDIKNPVALLNTLTIGADYTYARTSNRASYGDSDHNKHNGAITAHAEWETGDDIALFSDLSYTLDYVDSTNAGKNTRHTIALASNASFYFLDGNLSLHPSANIAYLTDTKAFSPNASLGLIYTPIKDLDLKASVSYAERIPTFSDLYWLLDAYGYHGNPNLKTEQGINGELGYAYSTNRLELEGSLFARDIYQGIAWDNSVKTPKNIEHSFYLGTEQTVSAAIVKNLDFSVSYQYNKSFDLSGSYTLADNIELGNVRKHTAKAALTYTYDSIEAYLDAQYLGKTQKLDPALLLNLSVSWQATERLRTYIAIDNLLNTSYELTDGGYPMPGMKIRLGGSFSF